jgi:hypothetical protein
LRFKRSRMTPQHIKVDDASFASILPEKGAQGHPDAFYALVFIIYLAFNVNKNLLDLHFWLLLRLRKQRRGILSRSPFSLTLIQCSALLFRHFFSALQSFPLFLTRSSRRNSKDFELLPGNVRDLYPPPTLVDGLLPRIRSGMFVSGPAIP